MRKNNNLKSKMMFCVSCGKLMSFKEGKWVKRQKISDFNGIIDEWYSFVCFSCFEKINSLIVRDLVFCPVVFSED